MDRRSKRSQQLRASPPHPVLTSRERDLVGGIIGGKTNHEMAREFGISEQSVKNALSILYQKCHVRSRLELALLAIRRRLVQE
jgi:DNA-binding NarL/FixJ family response regulator